MNTTWSRAGRTVAGAADSTDDAVLAYRGRYQIRLSEAPKLLTPAR